MEYPREQLEQVFLQLPPDLKLALFSEVNAILIGQIAEKFHLPEEKIPLLAGQIGLVIIGLLPPQNLSSELKTVLNIDGQMSQAITQEVNFKIFTPIRLSLRKIHGLATPEEISTERAAFPSLPVAVPKPAAPPPIPAPVAPSRPTPPSSFVKTTEDKSAPIPSRPPVPAPTKPIIPPIPASARPPIPQPPQPSRPVTPPAGMPRPFIPPRPLTPPGVIVPKTITPPSSAYQRPAYESPALSQKPITPPAVSPPPPPGGPPKPITPPSSPAESRPITPRPTPPAANLDGQTPLASKPETFIPAEPIDLTKININDLKGNVVDLKNLE